MPAIPPDPDTVRYPLKDATLILSVSDDPFSPQTGVKTPLDIYCENLQLNQSISDSNTSDNSPARFGFFTRKLSGPDSAQPIVISVSGADSKDATHPNGSRGGIVDMYVEDLSLETAQGLGIQALGGKGYTPVNAVNAKEGKNGGNGGDGGQVSAIVGGQSSKNAQAIDPILDHLADTKEKWPADFSDDITEFIRIVGLGDVKTIYQVPDDMKTVDDVMKVSLSSFRSQVRRLQRLFMPLIDDVHIALSNGIDIRGGKYGTGSKGSVTPGKSGHLGKDQKPVIASTLNVDVLLQTKTCYVHPIQCQMLMEKARQLFWSGSLDNKARSATILQRLQEKLKPFLLADSDQLTKSPLVQAYREAEPRLYIVGGPKNEMPVSVKRLTSLTAEADMTLKHILSGVDFYGKTPDEVPRGSFTWYHDMAEYFLKQLEFAEKTYTDWFNDGKDASAQLKAIRSRGQLCNTTIQLKKRLISEVLTDLDTSGLSIEIMTDALPPIRQAVADEAKKVTEAIKKHFGFSFDELVSALGQILFVKGSPSMIALQTSNLIHQGLTKIERDDGIQIPKEYLLSKLRRISGTFAGLEEGYKVLDGKIDLADPGANKLVAAEEELEKLLSDFANELGDDILNGVRKKFNTYVELVLKRNDAVLRYNSDITLLVQYHREIDSLEVEKEDLVRDEYEKLGAEHPSMTAFMKKTYQDAIKTTQSWLYKQERAYSFVALSDKDIIGEALEGVSVSQYNLSHLRTVQAALYDYYGTLYKEKKGRPPQLYTGAKFYLDKDDVEDIQDSGKEGIVFMIDIPPTDNAFRDKADIRLTKVRFFAPGAKTDTNRLEAKITHSGKETIANNHLKRFKFTHDPIKVTFRYNMETMKAEGDDTVDGNISWPAENDFALPGPFTQWKIEIRDAVNKNLDLSSVSSAYLEFDYQFETV